MLTHKVPGMEFLQSIYSAVWHEFNEMFKRVKPLKDPNMFLQGSDDGDIQVTKSDLIQGYVETLKNLFDAFVSGDVIFFSYKSKKPMGVIWDGTSSKISFFSTV